MAPTICYSRLMTLPEDPQRWGEHVGSFPKRVAFPPTCPFYTSENASN